MKTYLIRRIGLPDIEFEGKLLAKVSSESTRKAKETGRWTELAVYATTKQNFVLTITGKSNIEDEVDLTTVHFEDNLEDLVPHLSLTWLAKELLELLDLRVVQRV